MTRRLKNADEAEAIKAKGVSRREFFTQGAAAGVSAAALMSGTGAASAAASTTDDIQWDYEADVVVVGAGCAGLPVAIRARDGGLTVIAVDQNFDPGGKMLHSGAQVSLGGGDPVQLRDIAGQADKEGFITVPPIHKPEEMTEDVDFPVQRHYRLVGGRRRGDGALSLQ